MMFRFGQQHAIARIVTNPVAREKTEWLKPTRNPSLRITGSAQAPATRYADQAFEVTLDLQRETWFPADRTASDRTASDLVVQWV
jgi:hypothetical protein